MKISKAQSIKQLTIEDAPFSMGIILVMKGAEQGATPEEIKMALQRYGSCDFGDSQSMYDQQITDHYDRQIVGSYQTASGFEFQIVTLADRSFTIISEEGEW